MSGRDAVLALLRGYKRWISPILPAACRFEPSCSLYARDAVELHGVWRGGRMTLWRLLRCQPFSRGGFDPVPVPPVDGPSTNAGRVEIDG